MWALRQQKFMQKHRLPSFFHTSTTALHQTLWLGLMVPDSNISFKKFLTYSTSGGGIHLNHSLKGVLSVTFMICSVEWVQPGSAGSNENMSWYLTSSQQAASANSGVQESRPLKSNLLNNLPCLCLIVSLGVWKLGDLLVPSCNPSDWGFGHWQCSCCPGHWGFLPEGLWIGGIIPYHYNCFFTAFS